jgi:hypothetical protein
MSPAPGRRKNAGMPELPPPRPRPVLAARQGVPHGPALAAAAGWIAVPLLGVVAYAALAVQASEPDADCAYFGCSISPGLAMLLIFAAALVPAGIGWLAGAIYIARRAPRARSVTGLGMQAGLVGIVVAAGAAALLVLSVIRQ